MLRIDLWKLRPSSTRALKGAIAPDAGVWRGSGLKFADAVEVAATAAMTPEGGVVVRGRWRARPVYECGRCLEAVELSVERPLAVVFQPGEAGDDANDPDLRVLDPRNGNLELDEAIREDVLLELPRYHCPGEDRGRCVACGERMERFVRAPSPSPESVDPRWSALAALRPEPGSPESAGSKSGSSNQGRN